MLLPKDCSKWKVKWQYFAQNDRKGNGEVKNTKVCQCAKHIMDVCKDEGEPHGCMRDRVCECEGMCSWFRRCQLGCPARSATNMNESMMQRTVTLRSTAGDDTYR